MKKTKEECLELGIKYIKKHNCYPAAKGWSIKTAGCSRDRIYENFGNWPEFIAVLSTLIEIPVFKEQPTGKKVITSKTLLTDRYCKHCNKVFNSYHKKQKYCSRECASKSPNMGGYRKGSGRSKSGYCDGIYCGSTYELAWVVYNLDNDIPFSRCYDYFCYSGHKYYPDFIQDSIYIEIKGYHTSLVDLKTQAVLDAGKDILVLYKDDLSHCFKWIKDNYDCPVEWLFDSYKPKYKYTCSNCNKIFSSEVKRETSTKYCSRVCSGYGVKKFTNNKLL
jgi:hypothetical protein